VASGTIVVVRIGPVLFSVLLGVACKAPAGPAEDEDAGTDGPEVPIEGELSIVRVEANQGVQVDIGEGEQWVGERNTFLLADRPTLIRVIHEVSDDWTPRDIRAQLELSYPDGSSELREQVLRVAESAKEGLLETQFSWVLERDAALPELEYQVRLYELETDSAQPELITANPGGGPMPVGLEDLNIEMNIVLVPAKVSYEGCGREMTITDEVEQELHDWFYQRYPVQDVEISRLEQIVIELPGETSKDAVTQAFNAELAALRPDLAPDVWLIGLHEDCDSNGFGCKPNVAQPTVGGATSRWVSFRNMNHHHNFLDWQPCFMRAHLRGYVRCNDEDELPEPVEEAYPHENGITNGWGWGVLDGYLRDPTFNDLMVWGECGPEWQSDHGWAQAGEYQKKVTALVE
jgi:hypothetical protein